MSTIDHKINHINVVSLTKLSMYCTVEIVRSKPHGIAHISLVRKILLGNEHLSHRILASENFVEMRVRSTVLLLDAGEVYMYTYKRILLLLLCNCSTEKVALM